MNVTGNFRPPRALVLVVWAGLFALPAHALDSDRNQQATLEADDFELDLETGMRTYRGNVIFRQGSIRLDCDELVTRYNEHGQLDNGVCTGNPGKLRQRPQGRDFDVHGRARSITLDRGEGEVVLEGGADVEMGGDRIRGGRIVYDLETRKAKVSGGVSGGASGETADASEDAPARPSLIIQPRQQPAD